MTPENLNTTELLARYDRPGPRYTSYPTALEFSDTFTAAHYEERLAMADRLADEPLSMYAHLPEAVHRIQGYDLTRQPVERSRAHGFQSVNIDLIYGLPYQTLDGFRRTLDQVITIRPERVAVYSFAFVPWIKAHMKHLPNES